MFNQESLMKAFQSAQNMQAEYAANLARKRVRGTAGGEMVTVVINGHKEVTSIEISEDAVRNPTLLADMVLSALHSAYATLDKEGGPIPSMLNKDMQGLLDSLGLR